MRAPERRVRCIKAVPFEAGSPLIVVEAGEIIYAAHSVVDQWPEHFEAVA